jgi:hypothetical protein
MFTSALLVAGDSAGEVPIQCVSRDEELASVPKTQKVLKTGLIP